MKTIENDWDTFFINIVYLVAMRSKDRSSKLGAVIVDRRNRIVSTGYNGLCSGVKYTEHRHKRPLKYDFFEHAERNAIYNSGGNNLTGTTLYTNAFPCIDCARGIIQCGITKVVTDNEWKDHTHREALDPNGLHSWSNSEAISKLMFNEAGVKFACIDNVELVQITRTLSGHTW